MYIQVHILGGGSLLYRKELDGIHPTVFIISVPKYKILFDHSRADLNQFFFDTEYSMKKRRSSSRGR